MRIYEYNESDKTLNTECGLFYIGDTVQLTEIDSHTPIKTTIYGARMDSTEYVLTLLRWEVWNAFILVWAWNRWYV